MSPKIPFSPKKVIDSITDWTIIYFKDINIDSGASAHNYFVIPTKSEDKLVLCIVTSKVEKNEIYYERLGVKESLVHMTPKDMPGIFTKPCVVDCNKPKLLSKRDLEQRVDPNCDCYIQTRAIEDQYKQKIVAAILKSRIVDSFIKKQIT